MSNTDLDGYLKDHLAGSVAGLELVRHLVDVSADPDLRQFFQQLRLDLEADQDALERVLKNADVSESGLRHAAAWLLDKAGWAKIKLAGTEPTCLGMLQALEALLLGITGKRALWRALAVTSLPGAFAELERRAEDQIARVEERRLTVAQAALVKA
jgi:hypothetical protein